MTNELDRWVRHAIAPTLREHGFRGGPRRFDRRSDGFVAGIQVQASSGNVLGRWRFTLNYGVWHANIGRLTGIDNPHAWHAARRVGATVGRDPWWDVGGGSDPERVARDILERLSSEVLPFLDEVATSEGFEAYWQGEPEPGRSHFLALLEASAVYDATLDPRTPAQRQLDLLAHDPRVREWLESDPAAAQWVAWCPSCGRPATRVGAPPDLMVVAMLRAVGASEWRGDGSCEACRKGVATPG
jgi:hypothetical protein